MNPFSAAYEQGVVTALKEAGLFDKVAVSPAWVAGRVQQAVARGAAPGRIQQFGNAMHAGAERIADRMGSFAGNYLPGAANKRSLAGAAAGVSPIAPASAQRVANNATLVGRAATQPAAKPVAAAATATATAAPQGAAALSQAAKIPAVAPRGRQLSPFGSPNMAAGAKQFQQAKLQRAVSQIQGPQVTQQIAGEQAVRAARGNATQAIPNMQSHLQSLGLGHLWKGGQ